MKVRGLNTKLVDLSIAMTTVTKILISYEEYSRLREIARKFDQISSENAELRAQLHKKGNGNYEVSVDANDLDNLQSGSGQFTSIADFNLDRIATLVAKKLNDGDPHPSARPTIVNWQSYEKTEPTNAVTYDEQCKPPLQYDQNQVKSDRNDSMDIRKLLSLIPKQHKGNAIRLLDSFEHRPQELSFDSSGVIYINQASIPNSDIFKFFPLLFKKRHPKLPGFLDFVNQLNEMGLSHLLTYQPKHIEVTSTKNERNVPSTNTPLNWWYIGP